jgi:hypothetical protein
VPDVIPQDCLAEVQDPDVAAMEQAFSPDEHLLEEDMLAEVPWMFPAVDDDVAHADEEKAIGGGALPPVHGVGDELLVPQFSLSRLLDSSTLNAQQHHEHKLCAFTQTSKLTQRAYVELMRLPLAVAGQAAGLKCPEGLDTVRSRCLRRIAPIMRVSSFLEPPDEESNKKVAPYISIRDHASSLVLCDDTFSHLLDINQRTVYPFLDDIIAQAHRREEALRVFHVAVAEGQPQSAVDMHTCVDGALCTDHDHVVREAWDGTLYLRVLADTVNEWREAWLDKTHTTLFLHHMIFLDGFTIRNFEHNGGFLAGGTFAQAPHALRSTTDSPYLLAYTNITSQAKHQHLRTLLEAFGREYRAHSRGFCIDRKERRVNVVIIPFVLQGDTPGKAGTQRRTVCLSCSALTSWYACRSDGVYGS